VTRVAGRRVSGPDPGSLGRPRAAKLAPVTAGDYGGRGYDHDPAASDHPWTGDPPDQTWSGGPPPSPAASDGRGPDPGQRWSSGQERPSDHEWAPDQGWRSPPEQAWPAHRAEPDDATWSGEPPAWPASGQGWPDTQTGESAAGVSVGAMSAGAAADSSGGWRALRDDTASHRRRADHRRPSGRARPERDGGRRRGMPLWQELPLLLVIAFCLAVLVRTFLLQAFYIPSPSMEETLVAGDRVLVNKVVYQMREPVRGEVVVFRGTDAWSPQPVVDDNIGLFATVGRVLGDLVGVSRPDDKEYIKRIIGLPGDRISCCDVEGRIFVNGHPLDEDYVIYNAPLDDSFDGLQDCRSRRFGELVVEPGQMFVMGDHRAISHDSRCQGVVPLDNITGRAFAIVWPSGRWTGLSAPEAFAAVPQAAPAAGVVARTVEPDVPAPGEVAVVLPLLLAAAVRSGGRGARPGRLLAGRRLAR
jgi:signal peptidase I